MKTGMLVLGFGLVLIGTTPAHAAEEHAVQLTQLPAAVQKAIKAYVAEHKATLRGTSAETEHGAQRFEAEMRVDGVGRDVTFDHTGAVVSVEEVITVRQLPAGARAAIEKAAQGGRIGTVEMITEGSTVSYEAHITKSGKTSELKVNAAGAKAP